MVAVERRQRRDPNAVPPFEMRLERLVLHRPQDGRPQLVVLHGGSRLRVGLAGLARSCADRALEGAFLGHYKPPRSALVPQRRDAQEWPVTTTDLEGRIPFAVEDPRWGGAFWLGAEV